MTVGDLGCHGSCVAASWPRFPRNRCPRRQYEVADLLSFRLLRRRPSSPSGESLIAALQRLIARRTREIFVFYLFNAEPHSRKREGREPRSLIGSLVNLSANSPLPPRRKRMNQTGAGI